MQQENPDNGSEQTDIAALSESAIRQYRDGHLAAARVLCERIIERQERPDIVLMLGNIAHELGEFESAAARYRQFLALMPKHSKTHYNLGLVLFKQTKSGFSVCSLQH